MAERAGGDGAGVWVTGGHGCVGLLLEIIQNQQIIEAIFLSTSFVHANVNVLSGPFNGAFN